MVSEPTDTPQRPLIVTVAAAMVFLNALVLAAWWIVFPESVISNGGQIFFMVVWVSVAVGMYIGSGWWRHFLLAAVIVFVWGLWNSGDVLLAAAAVNLGDHITKVVALISYGMVLTPSARRWFRSMRLLLDGESSQSPAEGNTAGST